MPGAFLSMQDFLSHKLLQKKQQKKQKESLNVRRRQIPIIEAVGLTSVQYLSVLTSDKIRTNGSWVVLRRVVRWKDINGHAEERGTVGEGARKKEPSVCQEKGGPCRTEAKAQGLPGKGIWVWGAFVHALPMSS